MSNKWLDTLAQQGATLAEGRVANFGDPQAELTAALEGDILCDLSHLALIKASGEDSITFLQGQTTNDVRKVSTTHHQLNSYCSPKGRMLALFRLFQRHGDYYLSMPQELLETTLKRLQMFVLMSKVKLEDAGDTLLRFGLSGPNAEKLLQEQIGVTPAEADTSLTQAGITLLRIPGTHPRFEIYGDSEAMQNLWQSLGSRVHKAGADCWDLLDIHAGLPAVYRETVEAFVPQMVNLQLVNGVSFKKGCYTGQEIVARMQYLGKLKRRMYLTHVEATERPLAGDELNSSASASGQGAGKVVKVAPSPGGGFDMLCVIEIAATEGAITLGSAGNAPLSLLAMPYEFEQPEASPQSAG
jgi:folate-binding protein YgfZ